MTRKRPPRKSRVSADRPRVTIRPPKQDSQQGYAEQPGYCGHNGGSFAEAGYSTGQGVFGFRHDTMTTGRTTRCTP
jgi:hypothetical protein